MTSSGPPVAQLSHQRMFYGTALLRIEAFKISGAAECANHLRMER